ncbi:MAG: HAD family hydrolase [Prevotella sp.]|nr:HAD family hydrolase [Prevotella sp.]
MPETLYVTDLDGTLLTSGQYVSERSCEIINKLTERGLIFSYATARSLITARKVTAGLDFAVPAIVYNGAFIVDTVSGERLVNNVFAPEETEDIFRTLRRFGAAPLVYSIIDGTEKFSYIPDSLTRGMADFLDSRRGDPRHRPLASEKSMLDGDVFYFTCIDEAGTMAEVREALKERYYTVYSRDIYSGDQWLEVLPKAANKANAVLQLKEYLHCKRLVVFGDGENDIPMFKTADECYAVENAAPSLKEFADGIIGGNNEDSVAEFLLNNN